MAYSKKGDENKYASEIKEGSQVYLRQLDLSLNRMGIVHRKGQNLASYIHRMNEKLEGGEISPREYIRKMDAYIKYFERAKKMDEKRHKKPKKIYKGLGKLEDVIERLAAVVLLAFASISVLSSLFNKSGITGYVVLSESLKVSNLFILNFVALIIVIVVLLPSRNYKLSKKVVKKRR